MMLILAYVCISTGTDAKESLGWLSYITSPDGSGGPRGGGSELVRANIGAVDARALFKQLSVEYMQPDKR
jgi:hypothetical protein